MPGTDYVRPLTLDSAWELMATRPNAKILAGGSALIPRIRSGSVHTQLLIDIGHVTELRTIAIDGAELVVGPTVTLRDLCRSSLVHEHAPLLADVAGRIADRQVRHIATIGGALANADPAADLPLCVIALDAILTLADHTGSRSLPAADFIIGRQRNALRDGELLIEIRVPLRKDRRSHFERFSYTSRPPSLVGVALCLTYAGDVVHEARLVAGNLGPTPLRFRTSERILAISTARSMVEIAAAGIVGIEDPADECPEPLQSRVQIARALATRAIDALIGDQAPQSHG